MSRYVILDIGSNTSKLLVGQYTREKGLIEEYQSSFACRISSEKRDGIQLLISHEKISHIVKAIKILLIEAEKFHPYESILVGTEALRRTKNITQLKQAILEETGLSLIVLSGEQEANGIAQGITTDPKYNHLTDFHAFDLGGGSLEIIQVNQKDVTRTASMPLGSVALMRQLIPDPFSPIDEKLKSLVINSTRRILEREAPGLGKCKFLIASGGTIVHLRKTLEVELFGQEIPKKFGELNRFYIKGLASEMCGLDLKDRRKKFPLIPEDRLDIFPIGLLTILGVMDYLQVDEIHHTFHNLRYGIIACPDFLKKA
jgi:exopolyphosphatase / guanosine-5'-triphosphate,3'-diphosphate pyrophosphatase